MVVFCVNYGYMMLYALFGYDYSSLDVYMDELDQCLNQVFNTEALAKGVQGSPGDQQGKNGQDQGAIQALFSFTSSRACIVLEAPFGGSNQDMVGRVLLFWTP